MNRRVLLDTLTNIRFLHGIDEKHIEKLADITRLEEYDEGGVLFHEDESVDDVFLIVDGGVALEVASSGIDPQHLLTLGAGDSVGWSALMHALRRTATARAVDTTHVFRIDGEQLQALCEEHPRFGYQIMRAIAGALAVRLHALQLKFFDVYRLQPSGFICGAVDVGVD